MQYIDINDINMGNWKIYSKGKISKNKTIYYDNDRFMKIWHKDFIWKKNFMNALNKNFYDEISILISVITCDGDIIGYITKKVNDSKLIHDGRVIKDTENAKDVFYQSFLEKVCNKFDSTGLIHIDLTYPNIGILNNNYYIFDLESVVDITEIDQHMKCLSLCPLKYQKYIINKFH